MKRILFYITNYPGYGGIEKVTTYLANALDKLNYQITILSFHCGAKELLCSLEQNIKCVFVPNQEQYICEENDQFINQLLHTCTFDWIIYQDCYSPIHQLLYQTDVPLEKKLIVVEHNSPCCHLTSYQNYWHRLHWLNPKDAIRKILYPYKRAKIYNRLSSRHRELLQISNKYILLSDKFKPEIHYLVGNKFDTKILSIPNPVTLPPIASNTTFHKKNKVVFVGRLVEDKGINYLMQIWAKVEPMTAEWTLSIVGDGPLREQIEEFIQHNKLTRIQLLGSKADVSPYLEESSILMMTSIFEGWGLVLTEAMSRGCVPLAFSSFASLTDIIDHQINGYIIPPYQIDVYTKQLMTLISAPNLLAQLSRQAIVKSQTFTIDKIVQQWNNILK